jgi:glycosyltransferase involved in cell wall biosynthesis
VGIVWVKVGLKSVLAFFGKGEKKVAAVFGISPGPCHQAVIHIKTGAPEVPLWLFATAPPLPETRALCDRVYVGRASFSLFLLAQIQLWPYCVAIAVSTWTAEHGRWPLKLAPFFIPPFRVLLLNSWGGFFPGKPALVLRHGRRLWFAAAISNWIRLKEISAGCWRLVSYHMWHSSPVRRAQDIGYGLWRLVSYHVWRSSPVRRTRDVVYGCWRLVSYHIWRSSPVRRAWDEASGYALFALAAVLGWFSYPYRGWFKRTMGGRSLAVRADLSGTGVDHFVQQGHNWEGRAFADFVQSSDARWIQWQRGGSRVPPSEMETVSLLFDDPRTFAVARQSEARDWKPALFPMAPFRHLQPGTASQVLAPLGQTIFVDRAKLAALGVPPAKLTQTAWMQLFWKAAAAGWRCYSEPGPARYARDQAQDDVVVQPDFPEQETEFFLRFLADPELRELGPAEPDLSRGTISFAPALQSPLRPGRLRVLVVSPFLPYPLAHGGAVRIFNLCRELADRVDFILIALREAHEVVQYEKLHQVFREVYTVDIDERESNDERLPRQVRAAQSTSLRALIAEVCERLQPDLLQIEFTHMAGYRDCAPKLPAVLVEHDLTFKLYCQLAQMDPSDAARDEYHRWLEFELHWLAAYDAVWTMSEEDRRSAISEGSDPQRTFVVPNGVDVKRFAPMEQDTEPEVCHEVFYVGSFRHLPNILGFQKLCREVMPRVWQRVPKARLRVVAGPRHEYFWSTLAKPGESMDPDSRIEIHGYVQDLRPLYARASVVVVPLEVSAGTNIKVLEAMACGRTVVTTPIGCAGLGLEDEADAFIREDWEQFAEAVCETLLNAPLRSSIGAHARRTVEARFSWASIAGGAYSSYQAMITRWRNPRKDPETITAAPLALKAS